MGWTKGFIAPKPGQFCLEIHRHPSCAAGGRAVLLEGQLDGIPLPRRAASGRHP
jgi:hypothetical protein